MKASVKHSLTASGNMITDNKIMKVNERFIWASELLDIQPDDTILEIGCGAGILTEQIANKLNQGTITAIDRSEPMIKMAFKRNKTFIENGKVNLLISEFAKAEFDKAYDKIVAFNVNFFWKNPAKELEIIRNCLKPNGNLFVFYQAPYNIDIKAAQPIKEKLQSHSFQIVDVIFKKMNSLSAFCIVTKPVNAD